MRTGHHLHRLGHLRIPIDLQQLVTPGTDHIRQRVRTALVAFGAGVAHDLPVPGGLFGIDREHPVTGRGQRPHPRTPIGLDAHQHIGRFGVIGQEQRDQLVKATHSGHPLG